MAVLHRRDQWHAVCAEVWPALIDRCITTEAVVTEACHFALRGSGKSSLPLDFLLSGGIPIVGLETSGHRRAASLMAQYASLPMDYADATLVAVSEALYLTNIFTLDRRGFLTYRPPHGAHYQLHPAPTA